MGKHVARDSADLSPARARSSLVLGVVVAVLIGGAVWAVFHARRVDPPMLIVQPAAALPGPPDGAALYDPAAPTATPTTAPSRSATPSSPSPSPSATRPASASPAVTFTLSPVRVAPSAPPRPPSPTPVAPPQPVFTARYSVSNAWFSGFRADIDVTNRSRTAGRVEVQLTYPDDVRITVRQYWGNVTATASGRTLTFTSNQPVSPGATLRLGFQADKNTRRQVNPTSCTVNGARCETF
ncbi:cellulose binding domain-containing protein [Micromonospora sp. NPDC049679]|uniref:cellulose binding domain-containing protein n=1 Tax=Micromonospora sp. NPDC049679 TaxID=3155920 RepID=UPI0033EA4A8B